MKIEKLTENKIRVIVKPSDLKLKCLDIHLLMTKALEKQTFFTNMLEQAREEVGFNTDGCRLLIEAFSSCDDVLIFTITKYSTDDIISCKTSPKKLVAKRKTLNLSNRIGIYKFDKFDEFCEFCECINKVSKFDIKNFSKNITLYLYNDTYYLLIKNINTSYFAANLFYSIVSEFSKPLTYLSSFENKLIEHGKVIIKRNAITTGIKYFVHDKTDIN